MTGGRWQMVVERMGTVIHDGANEGSRREGVDNTNRARQEQENHSGAGERASQ